VIEVDCEKRIVRGSAKKKIFAFFAGHETTDEIVGVVQ